MDARHDATPPTKMRSQEDGWGSPDKTVSSGSLGDPPSRSQEGDLWLTSDPHTHTPYTCRIRRSLGLSSVVMKLNKIVLLKVPFLLQRKGQRRGGEMATPLLKGKTKATPLTTSPGSLYALSVCPSVSLESPLTSWKLLSSEPIWSLSGALDANSLLTTTLKPGAMRGIPTGNTIILISDWWTSYLSKDTDRKTIQGKEGGRWKSNYPTKNSALCIFFDTRIPQGQNYHGDFSPFLQKMPLTLYKAAF